MTNAAIIFNATQELLKAGKIQPTGRVLEFETADGEKIEVPETEAIHTFSHWKELGYIVRKGEHAVADFRIWKYTAAKKDESEEEAQERGHCFMKRAFWFSASQVEKLN